MSKLQNLQRVTFSPAEFAALFGKEQTWGYRQLYSGKVKATTEFGRTMIPAAEVERILATAGIYEGIKPKEKTKENFQKLAPKLGGAWQRYLLLRRQSGEKKTSAKTTVNSSAAGGRLPWVGKTGQTGLKLPGSKRKI